MKPTLYLVDVLNVVKLNVKRIFNCDTCGIHVFSYIFVRHCVDTRYCTYLVCLVTLNLHFIFCIPVSVSMIYYI